ncbi:MAG: hypothetical protein JSS82_10670 [Bacteroidetes bacterium]|nr:hypothetical protein [Bacteroidota bacterium]
MSLVNPFNPNNPFDFHGQRHMEIINSVDSTYRDQIIAIQDIPARENFVTSAAKSTAQQMYGLNDDPVQYYQSILGYQGLVSAVDFQGQYRPIIMAFAQVSQDVKEQFASLFDSLVNLPLKTDDDINNAINRIIDFENQVGADGDKNLLTGLSVAKYSLYGWWKLPPYNPFPPFDPAPEAKINWGSVICDAAGGLCGGLVGAAAGSAVYWYCTN